jgi:ABC-type branched-subunit amino acid transport system substrate-binding protein
MTGLRRRIVAGAATATLAIGALGVSASPIGAAEASGEPIKIGIYAPVAGNPTGVSFPYSISAAEAAVAAINDTGGAKDRPFELVVCDPKENPNDAAACANTFVDEGVVAVVGSFSTQGAAAVQPVLEASGVPNFGVFPISGADLQSTNSYPLVGGSVPVFAGAPQFLKDAGAKSVWVVHIDNASAAAVAGFSEQGAKLAKIDFAGSQGIPGVPPDMSPYVAAAQDAGADAVILAVSEAAAVQFIEASQAAGADFKFASVGFSPANLEALGDAAEGVIVPTPIPPDTKATRKQFPEMRQFHKDMAAQAKTGDDSARPENTQLPHTQRVWTSVYELADVIDAMPGDEVTAATVKAQIDDTPEFDIGFGKPFSFPGPVSTFPRVGNFWVYHVAVKDGKHVLAEKQPIDISKVFAS